MNFSLQSVLEQFGLARRPFTLVPDPSFFFMSESHKRAQASLTYGIMSRAPITLVTGEVGSGKTLILRELLAGHDDDEITVGLIANAAPANRVEMLRLVLYSLGQVVPKTDSYAELYSHLETFLVEIYRQGKRIVLIFDEAQNLDRDSLEHLRMLTNINFAEHELIQLLLIGQPELWDMISRPDLRQLAQRISASARVMPLSQSDVRDYVLYRLQTAGAQKEIFDEASYALIADASGGIPRIINQICDYGLLYAFGANEDTVSAQTVATVIEDNLLLSQSYAANNCTTT